MSAVSLNVPVEQQQIDQKVRRKDLQLSAPTGLLGSFFAFIEAKVRLLFAD
jgi:hypothetical protein